MSKTPYGGLKKPEWKIGAPRDAEWLEADGLGGYASGCVDGVRRRRYHALLLSATTPPTGRLVLVNGFDAWVDVGDKTFPISAQKYAPDVIHPAGAERVAGFITEPWPCWKFKVGDGLTIDQEVVAVNGQPLVAVRWRARGVQGGTSVRLRVRPFFSGRDYHEVIAEGPEHEWRGEHHDELITFSCSAPNVPSVKFVTNAKFDAAPLWFKNFIYEIETERGLDDQEDLFSPGEMTFDLSAGEAVWLLAADAPETAWLSEEGRAPAVKLFKKLSDQERERRGQFLTDLHRTADMYLVKRGDGRTIIAGYPWFTDWGRDTFISIRGLCLATGRLDEARQILMQWSTAVSEGMQPNRFPDAGDEPEYNSVDASLWYVVAVREYLEAAKRAGAEPSDDDRQALLAAVDSILLGYFGGTRYDIHTDEDGLLATGIPGQTQLTWMDARCDEVAVTPRVGKPVEIQALWINALAFGAERQNETVRWRDILEKARASFAAKFWNEAEGCLYDVVDVDHEAGKNDASFRPNQLLAVGGLPLSVLTGERARRVVDSVGHKLMTPLGPRSLAPGSEGYTGNYIGSRSERDACYHQGTVWPWMIGPFVDAWVRVRGSSSDAKRQARMRFVEPLMRHLGTAGLGHISEVADAEPPHTPRGCPFQAWSLAELLRLLLVVLAERDENAEVSMNAHVQATGKG